MSLRPIFIAAALLVAPATCRGAEVFTDPGAFSAAAVPPSCDQAPIGFEDATLATTVESRYEGVTFEWHAGGALVDDDVAGAACRETRCVRGPVVQGFGEAQVPWVTLRFATAVPALSMWLIDPGDGADAGRVTVEVRAGGAAIETLTLTTDGNDVDGGVFVGLVFARPADEVRLLAESPGDGLGIDDVWFPPARCLDGDGDGRAATAGDCDDGDPAVHPGAGERCDGRDDDCDGVVPAREADADRDGWLACEDPDGDGWAEADGDCRAHDADFHPAHAERCDGADNDCDGVVPAWESDDDRDGWLACEDPDGDGWPEADGDCRPLDAAAHPDAEEVCDGIDDDCDGEVPPEEADADRDGWRGCEDPDRDGWTEARGDCAPFDAAVHPGAPERCNGIDDDCSGAADPAEADADRDGWRACEGDCDDADPTRHPGAVERENGWDDDCDGQAVGGTVGCSAVADGAPPSWTTALFFALLTVVAVLGRRRRRRSLLLLAPALVGAAVVGRLDPYRAHIASPAYQAALAGSNFGTQGVFQLSRHALRDLLIRRFTGDPALRRFQGGYVVPPEDCDGPPFCPRELAYDIWQRGLDVRIDPGERLVVTVEVRGLVDDLSTRVQAVHGPVRLGAAVELQGACGAPEGFGMALKFDAFDVSDVVFEGYLGVEPFRSKIRAALEKKLAEDVKSAVIPLDLVACRPFGADAGARQARKFDLKAPVLRTVAAPRHGAEPFLMVGFDLVDLPDCAATTLGVQDLYHRSAFDRFDTSLIPEGGDVALGLSARLLHEMFWPLVWGDAEGGIDDLFEQAADMLRSRSMNPRRAMSSGWEGHHPDAPLPAPEADPLCTGPDGVDRHGVFILAPDMPHAPWLRATASVHGRRRDWLVIVTKVDVGVDVAMRFYVDNQDPAGPRLAVEGAVETRLDASCSAWKKARAELEAASASLQLLREELPILLGGFGEPLVQSDGGATLRLDRLRPLPAAVVLGGTFELDGLSPRREVPPLPTGTIRGIAIDTPADPVLVEGFDPTHRMCPPGDRPGGAVIRGRRWSWCEHLAPDGGALPAGAWCGLDVRPDLRPERCDDQDNDRDGLVDEGLVRLPGAARPRCLDAYADRPVPPELVSTCRGLEPRRGCPKGFRRYALWYDDAWIACLHPQRVPRLQAPACPDEDTLFREAEIVTCVAEGDELRPEDWPRLPGGIVGAGTIPGYGRPPGPFGGVPCAPPLRSVRQDAGWQPPIDGRNTRVVRWESPRGAGELTYCATPDVGADADADGLSDAAEDEHGSDPLRRDSAGDGLADGFRAAEGLAPLRPDTDRDSLGDFEERFVVGTRPDRRDTDADGLPDGYEVLATRTRPDAADSDGDRVPDGREEGLPDARAPGLGDEDADGDGCPDGYERFVLGTDPLAADTDDDGIEDCDPAAVAAADDEWYAGRRPRRAEGAPPPDRAGEGR